MPEGVEVKISSDLIKPLVIGKTITNAYSTSNSRYRGGSPEGHEAFMKFVQTGKCVVENVQTKGKFMYWTFTDYHYLMNTFGMTGQWSPTVGKHPCFVLEFGDEKIYFNDPRHFGTVQFVDTYAMLNLKLASLGWDPLQNSLQEWDTYIHSQVRLSKKTIGELLMNQGLFAGVGNYIRAEALYLSKLSPWRTGNSLNSDEIDRLQQAIVDVMTDSYNHQGATILTYTDAYGAEGKYSSCFKVYGQKNDPLGNKITKETAADGRTIHWSPAVQM
jgi:DNA-formamidopyrimidine glycosylase